MEKVASDTSVIICAYTEDRWENLVAAIASVQRQTLPAAEIIVVIDHNPALLQRVQENIAGIVVVENAEVRGLSGARNSGVAVAKSRIVAFLDDDAVATPNWLLALCEGFKHKDVLGVGGRVIPLWQEGEPAWFPEEFHWVVGCTYRGLPQTTAKVRNLIGANMSFRREIFDGVSGFRHDVGRIGTLPLGCEETELCIRIQQRWSESSFLYLPEASIFHSVPATRANWRYFCSRCYAEGLSKAVVTRYVGSKDSLSSERAYTLRTLPRGIRDNFLAALSHADATKLERAGAIVLGLAITTAGFCVGSLFSKGNQLTKKLSLAELFPRRSVMSKRFRLHTEVEK